MNDALTFLEDLWPTKPAAAAVQLWRKDNKKNHTFDSLEVAARWAGETASQADIYIAAGLAPRKESAPTRMRATAQTVIGIPGLWADIDVNGGPDGKTGAAKDLDEAKRLAHIVLEPTTIVMSGYGLQAWWLFEEPWLFALEPERQQAARLSKAFQAMLKAKAKDLGFSLDATHDLARLMRIPGTLNHKGEPPVAVELMASDGPRYSVEVLSQTCEDFLAKMETADLNGHAVKLDGIHDPPFALLDDLMDIDPEFAVTWRHERSGRRRAWGSSEFDMAIANALVQAGFSDQEIANCIAYHRKRYGDDKGKATRVDYLTLTISKARARERAEAVKEQREAEVEQAIEVMGAMAENPAPAAAAVTVSYFNKIVGGPTIKELVQDGRDPDMARYKLVFADGTELPIGTARDLINFERFRERYMTLTTHLPNLVSKKDWDKVVRSLLTAVEVVEDAGSTRDALTLAWIEEYAEHRMSKDKDRACQVHDPFEADGFMYLPLSELTSWVRKVKGERMSDTDVRQLLTRVGFERKTVAYDTGVDGRRSSRSYYMAPKSVIDRSAVPIEA